MAIIFSKLGGLQSFFAVVSARVGAEVYYIDLLSSNNQEEVYSKLALRGVKPLPVEGIDYIDRWYHDINENDDSDWMLDLFPKSISKAQKILFNNIDGIEDKLRLSLRTSIPSDIAGKVALYARAHPKDKHYLISTDILAMLCPIREKNVWKLFLPNIVQLILIVFRQLRRPLDKFKRIGKTPRLDNTAESSDAIDSKVAFVVHDGLSYGQLYDKNLYYSSDSDSILRKDRLLHISYSSGINPTEEVKWFHISGRNYSGYAQIFSLIKPLIKSIIAIRKLKHVLGIALMVAFYMRYVSYRDSLLKLSSLKLALIDYEILCPKSLLLAFESLGIETAAVQERYFMSFYKSFGTILNYYLCPSDFSKNVLMGNSSYIVGEYIPVGQYRSDMLFANYIGGSANLPLELIEAKKLNKKIIVALGFHTHLSRYESETDPLLSWRATILFIEDILKLANIMKETFIVLRYKSLNWINLPVFSNIINRVNVTDNVIISEEFSVPYYSYQLCSNADLLIAKHTSLGDECLSRGIPVLVHDYTHNLESIISRSFDYEGSDTVCHNFKQLEFMTGEILAGESGKYFDGMKHMFGSYGDGYVRERVHVWLEGKLRQLDISSKNDH